MKKKLIILISTIVALLVVIPTCVFAYFSITSNEKTINLNHNFNNDIHEVADYYEFVRHSKEKNYNDELDIENYDSQDEKNTNRKTIKLTQDIVLKANVFITSNISIDLNGYRLYLNGFALTFGYEYYGTTEIYSNKEFGYIVPHEVDENLEVIENAKTGVVEFLSSNNILLNLKNIRLIDPEGNILVTSTYIKKLPFDAKYYSYTLFKMISEHFEDDYFADIRRVSFTSLSTNPYVVFEDDIYIFDSRLYIDSILATSSNLDLSTSNNTISFIDKDVDLPIRYYNNKDIEVCYESSDETVINNYGKVLDNTKNKIVTLTSIVKYKGDVVAKCSFYLYVFDPTSSVDDKVIKATLYSYLNKYADPINECVVINKEIILPRKIFGVDIFYLPYKISNHEDAIEIFDGDSTKYLSLGTANVVEIDENYYAFIPTTETKALGIMYGDDHLYLKVSSNNMIVNNESSYARALLNEWYGGAIELNKQDNVYESKVLKSMSDVDFELYPEISSISYSIINDTFESYSLSNLENDRKLLSVVSGKIPEQYVQTTILSVLLTVSGKDITIQLPIKVKTPSEETQNSFTPYYTYYDGLIKMNNNYYVSQTFDMPFSYNNIGPIIVYDFVLLPSDYETLENQKLPINPLETNIFSIDLFYDGEVKHTFTFNKNVSFAVQLDEFLGNSALIRQEKLKEIMMYGDAKYIFNIVANNVSSSNVRFGLVYNYKNDFTSSEWITYCKNTTDEQIVTKLTIAGILKYGTDVTNETFYKWIYDKFTTLTDENENKLIYTIGDYQNYNKYILADWLYQNVEVSVTDPVINGLSNLDFKGLRFLKGTTSLNLSGRITDGEAGITIAKEISEMTNLVVLNLSNCTGITDGKILGSSNDYDNDSISRFILLRNLKTLRLNGCNIILFKFMENMTWLNEVYVYNQVVESNANYNSFYGNTGISNYQAFADLTDAGVKVYNTRQGTGEILFEKQKEINDYIRLKYGIIYQSLLKEGISITNMYESFSTIPSDYNLETKYGNTSVTNQSLSFRPVNYMLTKDTELKDKVYYIKDTSNQGYTTVAVGDLKKEDLVKYYEYVPSTSSTAFELVYSFSLGNNVNITLIVRFNVERY